jgi:predicted HicB family RNase H-like nuclease
MNKSATITIRVTPEFRARLKKAAYRSEMSQSEFISLALEVQVQRTLKEVKQ